MFRDIALLMKNEIIRM